MRQRCATVLRIASLYAVAGMIGWSQTSSGAAGNTLTAPVVQVVGSLTGGKVRAAGVGVSALDLGHLSWVPRTPPFGLAQSKDRNSFTISTNVGLIVNCPAADSGRLGVIGAFLLQTDSRYTVSMDGFTLSSAPAILGSLVPCGSTTQHKFELRVPVSAPAGPIDPNLGFQVTLR